MPTKDRRVNLDEWYTNDQAVERLAKNAGRPIDRNYPRTLARYRKVKTLDIGTRSKLYSRKDIDAYVVSKAPGKKSRSEADI